jgi:hypothetical protein
MLTRGVDAEILFIPVDCKLSVSTFDTTFNIFC